MTLDELRNQIDSIDTQLINLLGQRMKIVQKIGVLKQTQKTNVYDGNRKNAVLMKWLTQGRLHNLPESLLKKLYGIIHDYAVDVQKHE